jgi:hypothetical protein
MTTGWHVDDDIMIRYVGGRVPLSLGASVETHLVTCGQCRDLLRAVVADGELDRLERLWDEVVARVDAPRPRLLERLFRLAGVPEDTARLLAATPALGASWLSAMAAALGFAVVAAMAAGASDRGTLLFLTVAPILPVLGVAAAFHRGVDPTYEIALAAPYPAFRLLLLRSAAVTGVTCTAAVVAGLLLPDRSLTTAAWLLPAVALTLLTLVVARRVDVAYAATGVVAAWVLIAVLSHLNLGSFAAFGVAAQLTCLGIAGASSAVLIAGRHRYATTLGGV